ncbi:MAG TPA: DHHA1 domain-containing protein [Chloroflexota bacterium]
MTSGTERLYYRDSYLREFTARVVRATPAGDQTEVVLDRTAFYPEGGGQPSDFGKLGGAVVTGVAERDGEVIHSVRGKLEEGEVSGEVDWTRRFDHMQQHTGQHILSQAFERLLGARTVSFHMGAEVSTIDLATGGLEAAQAAEVEELANSVVYENRPVVVHFLTRSELESLNLRRGTEREGEIRVVEVEGFDSIPCGGTHVRSAGEIGTIKVTRWARRSGDVRVEFLCGWRALRDYRAKNETVVTLGTALAVRDTEVREAVERQLREAGEVRRQVEQLRNQLLDYQAEELAHDAEKVGDTAVITAIMADRSGEELKHLAGKIVAAPGRVALLGAAGEKAALVFARSEDVSLDASALFRQAAGPFGGRGGGRPNLAQGGVPDPAKVRAVLDEAAAAVRGLLA